MKIGDFAKVCGIPISVLRYYDSEGLIKPVYIDRFSGYRYYAESQISVCAKINTLKACGFSLSQIKELLRNNDRDNVRLLFEKRRQELENMLLCLDETQSNIMQNNTINEKNVFSYKENINLPFENDEAVIGRWEIQNGEAMPHSKKREVYFLPEGKGYWCYKGWTKGFLLYDDGCNTSANSYSLEQREDGMYMTVEFKSFDYWNGGDAETIVLKKLDSKRYDKNSIAIIENTDVPFKNDVKVLGKWVAHSYIERKSDFSENPTQTNFDPYFKAIEFLPDGECISVYGEEIIDSDKQNWTKGFLLRKFNHTVCAYEIKTIGGKEYLFVEWKSGDYRWGGFETDYYVFVRS